jgi:hypothetical protein
MRRAQYLFPRRDVAPRASEHLIRHGATPQSLGAGTGKPGPSTCGRGDLVCKGAKSRTRGRKLRSSGTRVMTRVPARCHGPSWKRRLGEALEQQTAWNALPPSARAVFKATAERTRPPSCAEFRRSAFRELRRCFNRLGGAGIILVLLGPVPDAVKLHTLRCSEQAVHELLRAAGHRRQSRNDNCSRNQEK